MHTIFALNVTTSEPIDPAKRAEIKARLARAAHEALIGTGVQFERIWCASAEQPEEKVHAGNEVTN